MSRAGSSKERFGKLPHVLTLVPVGAAYLFFCTPHISGRFLKETSALVATVKYLVHAEKKEIIGNLNFLYDVIS